MSSPWEHTTQWRDRFERLQEPTIDPAGDPLLEFINARIIELETAPRFDLTDELHDHSEAGPIAQRYAEYLRKDCVVFRWIAVDYAADRSTYRAVLLVANRWADHPEFEDAWRLA